MALRSATRIANRSRTLRSNLTEPEIMLWSRLKGRGHGRPIFRCPAAKLAVEVDGRTHWDDEAQARDDARDAWLRTQGITVTRIGAGSVYRELTQVVDGIILRAEALIAGRA